jgi:hypothetical protein
MSTGLNIWRTLDKQFQFLKTLAVKWLLGITSPGDQVQIFRVTGGGTGTDTVTFTANSRRGTTLLEMADTTYEIFLGGEFAASLGDGVYPDLSSKTTTGFDIIGLGNAEVCSVLVIGRTKGMPDPEG